MRPPFFGGRATVKTTMPASPSFSCDAFCDFLRVRPVPLAAGGFTLVELIVVLMVIGILAVAAIPRFADRSDFEARGFHDETLALLRYGQKSAVAQRRTVCVAVNADGVALTIDTHTPPDGNCDGPLALPMNPKGGSGLAGSGFRFLASGRTNQSGTLTLTVSGANNIQVDAVTGYVR